MRIFRCVSRSRFWGTPMPIWASADLQEIVVIGSIAELEEATGEKVRCFWTTGKFDVRDLTHSGSNAP